MIVVIVCCTGVVAAVMAIATDCHEHEVMVAASA